MLLLATAVFVGSAACQPCHPSIYSSYMRTPMARSSGKTESLPDATINSGTLQYRISANRLHFDGGSVSFDYFVGSNKAGRSFLFQREGYVYELPVTWYQRIRNWDASPGYEGAGRVTLDRAIDPTCLSCHASRLQPVYGTQNRYADPPFLESGVACERCHGAGSEHVRDPARFRMVNPADLEREARDSVCSQCHLSAEARVDRPNRKFGEFRAGDRLADYATYFAWSGKSAEHKVTSHVEDLSLSRCFRNSGGKLWCGTCHEPHTNANRTQAACVACHRTAHRQDETCAGCHMPSGKAADITHGTTTDHSIRWSTGTTGEKPGGPRLTALVGDASDRSLGLAYAELGDSRASGYLLRAQPADAPVLVRLALQQSDKRRAAALYESALRMEPADVVALVNLGVLYGEAGRVEEAGRLWRRALDANPAIEEAVLNLARVSARDDARRVLDRYLEFNPASQSARAARDGLR